MHFTPRFYRVAAICSGISALTTLGLIFLPLAFAPADGFEGRMARVADPAYVLRSWVYLVHPFVTFAAALAVAVRLRFERSGPALVGAAGFLVWGATEALQQAMTKFAFDRWRVAWANADQALRTQMPTLTTLYDGLWDAMYLLLLIAFMIANFAYAVALVRGRGLAQVLAWLYAGAALLTLSIIVGELGGPVIPASISFWIYPAIQPLARALIGVWLWREADERRPLGLPVRSAAA